MKNKIRLIFSLILLITIAIPLYAILPTAAQATMVTYPYIGATPNPVGIGQETLLHVGITQQLQTQTMGWEGLTVTITRPDNTAETLGPFKTDSTGGTGAVYVPTMVGNYTLQTHFPEQVTTAEKRAGGAAIGTVMLSSNSQKISLVVQEEQLAIWPSIPLPTEYWTRPIDAQLHEWHKISSNWVAIPDNLFALYNDDAPETAHILWAKELAAGGLAGGLMGIDDLAHSYECGDAYQGKFSASVIIKGVLYYNKYESRGQPYVGNNEIVAVNLKTGDELWSKPLIGRTGTTTGRTVAAANRVIDGVSEQFPDGIGRRLAFGQVFYWDSFNYHGVYGLLWTTDGTTWMAFDALTGRWIYTITNVPGSTTLRGLNGDLLRIQVNLAQGWVALWNATKMVNPQNTGGMSDGSWDPHGNVYNATGTGAQVQAAYEWNITIPQGLPGSAYQYKLGDRIVGSSTTNTEIVTWAISLRPGDEGRLLFRTAWKAPADWAAGNQSISRSAGSIDDGLITVWSKETNQHWGFSTETGNYLWGPTAPQDYLDHYAHRTAIAYGKFFSCGMSGILHCYDAASGKLLWTFNADDPYNQVLWANQWHIRPLIITDGKFYLGTTEHSPVDPKPKGAPFVCVDIETGQELFRVDGLFRQTDWGGRAVIGDSTIATMDTFDQRIYAIGRGPSALTVEAPMTGVTLGSRLVIRGTVNDISPGTKDAVLTMRFPNGVPAVSDESMSEWMLHVYKQFPRPTDATGVEVTIDVIDANGNYRNIGKTVSDPSGMFSYTWQPDIEGSYTVIATFAGSKSYYPSYAQTTFVVDLSPEATPTTTQAPVLLSETYFIPAVIGLTVAIIAGFALMTLLLLKKRP